MAQASSTPYLGDDTENLITINVEEDTVKHLGSEEKLSSVTNRQNYYGATEDAPVRESTNSGQSLPTIPRFRFLEVSDTGYFIPWDSDVSRRLKPGDEVAWLRPWSYYHHAIVTEVPSNCIKVIEKTRTTIDENDKLLTDKSWMNGQLYKVHYPDDQLRKNPAENVLERARQSKEGKGFRLSNNCEHFTTWCKVQDEHCNQYQQKCFDWGCYISRRLLQSAVHIPLVILFSDLFEVMIALSDAFGAMLLVIAELIYMIIVCFLIMNDVDKGQDFIANQPQSIGKRMKCAFFKTLFQSISLVIMALLFGVLVKDLLIICLGPWKRIWMITLEIGLGMFGALIGNIIGFFLFFFFQHRACFKLIAPHICPVHECDTPPGPGGSSSSDKRPEDHNPVSEPL